MQRTLYLSLASGLIGLGSVSCSTFPDDCFSGKECVGAFGAGGASSVSTTGTSTGMDPACLGAITETLSAYDAKRLISDKCGVFVQAGSTGAMEDGTQVAPFQTLQKAIDNAGNKRVYACSSTMKPFAEAVTVAAPVEVYGGFTCDNGWMFKEATRSVITGVAKKISLTLTDMADGAIVEGFKITSANASGPTGDSSVAVAIAAIDATLDKCDVEAGDGADGVDGVPSTGTATNGMDAPVTDPLINNACINTAALTVGTPGMTTCDDGLSSGGPGGKGGISGTNGGNGQAGSDGTPMDGMKGQGGAGQDTQVLCMSGLSGKDGDPGAAGGAGTALGTLSITGITNTLAANGTDGKPGTKAQGGGGGGGAKSGVFCPGSVDGNGASGGGGGAGGCGGKGGGAGKAGGSSIAIVSLGTKLILTKVTLKSGQGGTGGDGTTGQNGGGGGVGGKGGAGSSIAGSKAGCKGGDGGMGGFGGPGGGARGGHSIGLASVGIPTAMPATFTPDMPGSGGVAGTGGSPAGDGAKGVGGSATAACWDFSKDMTCAK